MKHILFVDDEPRILDGLKRMLASKRQEWDMQFAASGDLAIQLLAQKEFEVIVSDMRMPLMDGATLLKQVQEKYPHIIRFVLSGYAETEMTIRAVPVAHQFLSKPCNAQLLKEAIERSFNLQGLLNNEKIKSTLGKIDQLPVLPRIYLALTQALTQPEMSLKEVSEIVEQDMALCVKVLQLVNSAFFSLPHRMTNLLNAVSFIGLNMLKNLALSVEVFRSFQGKNHIQPEVFEALQKHALLTANLAKRMFSDKQKSEDAFIAGMLHDIGKLAVMAYLPEHYEQVSSTGKSEHQEWSGVEKKLFGISHAEIGAYLLGIWGLPYPVVEAVANHHEPERVNPQEFDILWAVYFADRLAQEHEYVFSENDLKQLEKMKMNDEFIKWKQWRQELLEKKEDIPHA